MATKLLFFGALKDLAGAAERLVDLPAAVTTGDALIDWIAEGDAALKEALKRPGVRLCIDQTIASDDAAIGDAREIAFLPPFSGG